MIRSVLFHSVILMRFVVLSLAPTAAVTMSTSTWLYIGLGLVGTLLVAGIGIGAAVRLDRACCARRDSSETGSEIEDQGPKQHAHVNTEGEDMKSFNVVPLEEAADPDLILLTNGKSCCSVFLTRKGPEVTLFECNLQYICKKTNDEVGLTCHDQVAARCLVQSYDQIPTGSLQNILTCYKSLIKMKIIL